MDNKEKETAGEEQDPRPLTDEEFEEYKKKEAKKERKARGIASAIWELFHFFT